MSTATKPSLSLKLLVDTKENRVLFAEAGKDFVDFLFSLMSLPVSTVIGLLSANEMVGCLGKIYQSLENLSETYFQPEADKDALLNPKAFYDGVPKVLLLLNITPASKTLYSCGYCRRYVTYNEEDKCPNCNYSNWNSVDFVQSKASKAAASSGSGGGYVKDVVTYMVMDDLEVKPMSAISVIALINEYGIRQIGDLQEVMVSIDVNEGLKFLKASFESKTVLSNVFLGRESSRDVGNLSNDVLVGVDSCLQMSKHV